jgi:mxaJ protein
MSIQHLLTTCACLSLCGLSVACRNPSLGSGNAAGWLRVCADPNNLPFSNELGQGFENRLAEMTARALGRSLRYRWWPQRRGFVRTTLNAESCDVIMGVPAGYEMTATTRPYYRSTFVFVMRKGERTPITSLDDPRLKSARIGVHVVGDDGGNIAPAQALIERGMAGNIRGYSIYGDYSRPNPPADLLAALARKDIDVAIAWGPLAGYFASREPVPLELAPVLPERDGGLPFSHSIAMGVRRADTALLDQLNAFITARQWEIDQLLGAFGVPLVTETPVTPGR